MRSRTEFDPGGPLPTGLTALEASAGTGKSFALCALALRYVAERGVLIGNVCVVSFTEAATAELRGRIRTRLVEAAALLAAGAVTHRDADLAAVVTVRTAKERSERLDRVRVAIRDFDAATITTIHGFCSRVVVANGGGTGPITDGFTDIEEVVNDLLLREYADDPSPPQAKRVVQAVRTRMSMPDAEMLHDPTGKDARVDAMADLVDAARAEVVRRQRARGSRTFDGLLLETRELLRSVQGPALVAALRDRYHLVLIDEFQDTDRVQWDIFHEAFVGGAGSPTMVVVGDPKQSIYRFRSAEITAYLDAVSHATSVSTLGTNRRSDAPLLSALDALLRPFQFGGGVRFESVRAAPGREAAGIHGAGASLRIRCVPHRGGQLHTGAARAAVRLDLVGEVARLLDRRSRVEIVDARDPAGRTRPLRPRDIAVLTRSNSDAITAARLLSAAGVPAATASADSVLETEAALQWRVLLRALERPGVESNARAAALGWFIGRSAVEVALDDETARLHLHDQLREWAIALSQRGLPQLMSLLAGAGLHGRLLALQGGERLLTDVEHISELLQTATGGRPIGPSALLALLDEDAGTGDEEAAPDLVARRIDRDDDAVQVLTVHRAKGLEFPVVLCPYLWTPSPNSSGIPHAHDGTQRQLDSSWVAGVKDGAGNKRVRGDNTREMAEEQRRLLYVALTRASHQCVVWWAATTTRGRKSELHTLLGDVLGVVPASAADLAPLVAETGGALDAVDIDTSLVVAAPDLDAPPPPELVVSVAERRIDRSWRSWSFSAMKSAADAIQRTAAGAPALAGFDRDAPVRGGADEPTDEQDATEQPPPPVPAEPSMLPGLAQSGLATAPGGTEFGTMVHSVLEVVDFTSPTLREQLIEVCAERMRYRAFRVDAEPLAEGLLRAIEAPLGGPLGATRLRDVGPAQRLDELHFDMALGAIRASDVGRVLAEHLPYSDPLRPWAVSIAADGFAVPVAGMLNGSIDLVARIDGNRCWVADYKTNQLGVGSAYGIDQMAEAMAHHHYGLQAAIYLVALHRYLRWRLPGYRPDTHLLGAAYLFVRGMDPDRTADDARGVLWWQPPSAAIEALDRLLAGEVSA